MPVTSDATDAIVTNFQFHHLAGGTYPEGRDRCGVDAWRRRLRCPAAFSCQHPIDGGTQTFLNIDNVNAGAISLSRRTRESRVRNKRICSQLSL